MPGLSPLIAERPDGDERSATAAMGTRCGGARRSRSSACRCRGRCRTGRSWASGVPPGRRGAGVGVRSVGLVVGAVRPARRRHAARRWSPAAAATGRRGAPAVARRPRARPSLRRGGRRVRTRRGRCSVTARPRCSGSKPDSLWPPPKNCVRASSATIGWVKRNTTSRSTSVVRPRVKAKPRTRRRPARRGRRPRGSSRRPTTMIVRRARFQPSSTAAASGRPSRTSSRIRSKYTMNESAVMPIATIRPATPARLEPVALPPAEEHDEAVGDARRR